MDDGLITAACVAIDAMMHAFADRDHLLTAVAAWQFQNHHAPPLAPSTAGATSQGRSARRASTRGCSMPVLACKRARA